MSENDRPVYTVTGELPEQYELGGEIAIPNGVDVRISFEEIEGGYRMHVANGGRVQSIDLLDGQNGEDGVSPAVEVSKSGRVTTITVTDRDGTTMAQVNDGEDGYTPIKGVDYFDGDPGYTPVKGVDYFDGEDGYTPIKGVDYFDGEDGYTPIKGVDYFDGEPGYTPQKGIDYFDGATGQPGKDGKDGQEGPPGYTPQKGIDYFDGEPGEDGISPTVEITSVTGGHRVTVTDAEDTHTFDVMDGADGNGIASATLNQDYTLTITFTDGTSYTTSSIRGAKGEDGKDGQDGYTPVKGVDYFDGAPGYTPQKGIDYFDGEPGYTPQKGIDYFDGQDGRDGQDGSDGMSPVATVSKSGRVATISITDKNGTTTAQVQDGDKGDTGDSGVYYGSVTPTDPDINVWIDPQGDGPISVTDVQVNGTSVVSNGVANVPVAGSDFGVVKTDSSNGIYTMDNGKLRISAASLTYIKGSSDSSKPIVPTHQHESVFYGLAKAAGADMASSSNEVGTYTDAAKVAIQKMLGIYEAPWELINEQTFNHATSASLVITTDSSGQAFELTDAIIMLIFDDANTASSLGGSGDVRFVYGDGSNEYVREFVGGMNHSAGSTPTAFMARVTQNGNLLYGDFTVSGTVSSTSPMRSSLHYGLEGPRQIIKLMPAPVYFSTVRIEDITGPARYVLYGKRKWN